MKDHTEQLKDQLDALCKAVRSTGNHALFNIHSDVGRELQNSEGLLLDLEPVEPEIDDSVDHTAGLEHI